MNEETEKYLRRFYNKLSAEVLREKKVIIKNSVILSFLKTRSNKKINIIESAHIEGHKIPRKVLIRLKEDGFIRETPTTGNYIITAKGIWKVEICDEILNENKFLEYLDETIFLAPKEKEVKLDDKEKTVLFSLIAVRAFSKKVCVDLNKGNRVLDVWENIIDQSFEKLKNLGLIVNETEKLNYGKTGNDHNVSALFRQSTGLPPKTRGIYKPLGNRQYFLDVSDGNNISTDKLKILIRLILNKKNLSVPERNDILNFMNDIAYNKGLFVFGSSLEFTKAEIDEKIKESFIY